MITAGVKTTGSCAKTPILLVEQNVKLAFELADDVVILNTGRVAFAGRAADVRDDRALITQHLGVF